MDVFYKDLPIYGAFLPCSNCGQETYVINTMLKRVGKQRRQRLLTEFQCSDCGDKFLFTDYSPKTATIAQQQCECGGMLRRDKPIVCKSCVHGKENKVNHIAEEETLYDFEPSFLLQETNQKEILKRPEGLERSSLTMQPPWNWNTSDRFSTVDRMDLAWWSALYWDLWEAYQPDKNGARKLSFPEYTARYNHILNSDEEMEAALNNRKRITGY